MYKDACHWHSFVNFVIALKQTHTKNVKDENF